ncbi:MAG: FAD-dependent oxidoreductase [Gammaproteobacteria bacterium]
MRVDVLILGGGAAGLWCLDRFRRAGYHAILLEAHALGAGQTIQAQGIIHGGSKYALWGVRKFNAARATSAMPGRWRSHLTGASEPSLADARVLSEHCALWLPRGSMIARAQCWGFLPLVHQVGLLTSRPIPLAPADWPVALRDSAVAVYVLNEQVISTGSLLQALAAIHERYVFLYEGADIRFNAGRIETGDATIEARATVLTAGAGNAALLRKAGIEHEIMQRLPLHMVLLRGALPPLFGHCVAGGRTQLTITAPAPGVWQVGGQIAEDLAYQDDPEHARRQALRAVRRWVPGFDPSGVEIALYRAVRAVGRTADLLRPSGVHVGQVAPGVVVAWPTKLCLTPMLADEVFALVSADLKSPAGYERDQVPAWPKPALAAYPWEVAEWTRAA